MTGNNYLHGGAGNDTLFGGQDADYFVFEANGGKDTVKDYVDGVDKIAIAASTGLTSASWAALDNDGNGSAESTLIAFSNGSTNTTFAILENILSTTIDSSDFVTV